LIFAYFLFNWRTKTTGYVEVNRMAATPLLLILLLTPFKIDESDKSELFKENFGELGTTTYLRFGSGLEGFIIKSIQEQLGIPVNINFGTNPKRISFTIPLSKKPH